MHIKESFSLSFYNRDKKEKDMGGKRDENHHEIQKSDYKPFPLS